MFEKIKNFIKNIMIFTTSYSLNVFEDPLSNDEEEYILKSI